MTSVTLNCGAEDGKRSPTRAGGVRAALRAPAARTWNVAFYGDEWSGARSERDLRADRARSVGAPLRELYGRAAGGDPPDELRERSARRPPAQDHPPSRLRPGQLD